MGERMSPSHLDSEYLDQSRGEGPLAEDPALVLVHLAAEGGDGEGRGAGNEGGSDIWAQSAASRLDRPPGWSRIGLSLKSTGVTVSARRTAFAALCFLLGLSTSGVGKGRDPAGGRAGGTGSVVVRVTGAEDERPLPGATVEVRVDHGDETYRGTTSEAGLLTLEGVPFGRREVTVWCPGRIRAFIPHRTADPPPPRAVQRFDVALKLGPRIEARVVTATGAPVPGVRLEAWPGGRCDDGGDPKWRALMRSRRPGPIGVGSSDAAGRCRLGAWTPGSIVTVIATRPGWTIGHRSGRIPHAAPKAGALELRIVLGRAGTLRGRVLGPEKDAVSGATIYVVPPQAARILEAPGALIDDPGTDEVEDLSYLWTRTDSEGSYEISHLVPGVTYSVFARAAKTLASRVSKGIRVEAPGAEIRSNLDLQTLCALKLHVTDSLGKPREGLHLVLTPLDGGRSPGKWKSGPNGRTRITGVIPGRYRLLVWGENTLDRTLEVALPRAKPLRIRLTGGEAVTGIVIDDRGAPLRGARIYGSPPRTEEGHATRSYCVARTGSDGTFRLFPLPAGPVRLNVHSGGTAKSVVTTAPASEVRIKFGRPGEVRFRLVPPRHRETTVVWYAPDGAAWGAPFSRSGSLHTVRDIPPGRIEFLVFVGGRAPIIRRFGLKPGESLDLGALEPPAGVTLRGRLVDGENRPVRGAFVVAYGNRKRGVRSDDDGAFTLPHVAVGPVDITVDAPRFPDNAFRVEVAEKSGAIVLRLKQGGTAWGRLIGPAGSPVSAVLRVYAPKRGCVREVRTEANGRFEIVLSPGKYWLDARDSHERPLGKSAPFELKEDGRVEVTVKLNSIR